jgi:hypothetical protein
MKNLDKIIKYILILTWVGLSCSILKAEVREELRKELVTDDRLNKK